MSTKANRMLRKIEEALEPIEAMALWLHGAREAFRSIHELVAGLQGQPDEALPLFRLTHQAEVAAKNRLKGQASVFAALNGQRAQFMEHGSRDAVRDVATLWYLFVEVNARFLAEKRALWLQLAYLASSYARWISDIERGAESLAERLEAALVETYGWTEAVDQLMDHYFREECPLLSEAEEALLEMVGHAEQMVERFNDRIEFETEFTEDERFKAALPKQIDLVAAKRAAQLAADELVRTLVDMARAEACDMMGQHKQALAFAERHL
jgi:hypothetical protein